MRKFVVLVRHISERTSDERFNNQVDSLIRSVTRMPVMKNWSTFPTRTISVTFDEETKVYTFKKKIEFDRIKGHKSSADKQWNSILIRLIRAGMHKSWNKYPWTVESEGAEELRVQLELDGVIPSRVSTAEGLLASLKSDIKDMGKISIDAADHYKDIYGRDDQIKIIRSAIIAGEESDWSNRFHCVLYGPPGCGKTEILAKTCEMLGVENDSYLKFDATSTTEAGAQKILLDSAHVPPILIVEEIEKQDEKALRWLLGLLDHRAEIRKTNFRIGTKARNVKMLCLATVNDLGLFKKVMSGALASRFAHEIYCPRPDRAILQKILEREVAKSKGRVEWIEPTLKYCYDEKKINDPRKILPICLCGRDALLDNSYQKSLTATEMPSNSKDL